MKSIVFTTFRQKLLNGSKARTFRVLFIPKYIANEIVKIDFKEEEKRETLFQARILKIYPKQIKNVNSKEARLDGFKSIRSFREGILKINKIDSLDHWGFFILFAKIKTIFDFTKFLEECALEC